MIKEFKYDYLPEYNETGKGGVIFPSTFESIKKLYEHNPQAAGELAISAIELLLCGGISSDDYNIEIILEATKAINKKHTKKYQQKIEASKQKEIADKKLEIIAQLHLQGLNQRQIGERIGCSQQVISTRIGIIKQKYPELLQDFYSCEETVQSCTSCENTGSKNVAQKESQFNF